MEEQSNDLVNHPPHYTSKDVECIDWIEMMLTPEEFKGYLKGNVLKYTWRCEQKGKPIQDTGKAGWYLERLGLWFKKQMQKAEAETK